MDKLRKIGAWFWNNKERMVLIVMVIVLAYRVYGIVYPPETEVWPRIPVPQTELPQTDEEKQTLGLPSSPPLPPTGGVPGTYTSIYEKNPFWYHASQAQNKGEDRVNVEDLNIELLDIQDVSGKPRARLRTIRTTKWYSEGEQFEEFELVQINVETQTVVIYSERYSQRFELEKK